MEKFFSHKPVLLKESIDMLNIKAQGIYLDLTFGRGGHSNSILNKITTGKLIAFDKDLEAVEYGRKHIKNNNFKLIHSDFSKCIKIIRASNLLAKIDGMLLDLGLSSPQLEDKQRGFSFNADADLDMRMDRTQKMDAKTWLKKISQKDLASVLYNYGEEKKSRQIAKKIKEFQKNNELTTTKQLADIVSSVVKTHNKHPATRTFQAIRIAVNNELSALQTILNDSYEILSKEGTLVVISFHSLEDRMVKKFFINNSKPPNIPKKLPIIDFKAKFKSIKKAKASGQEVAINKKSRSAILRGGIKC